MWYGFESPTWCHVLVCCWSLPLHQEVFHQALQCPLSTKKQHSPIPISSEILGKKHCMDVPPLNHYLLFLFNLLLMEFMLERVRCVVLRLPSPPPTSLLFLCRVTVLATNLPVANENGEWIWSSSWFVTSLRLHPITELSWGFCRLWRRILCWFSVWMTLRQNEMNKVALHQLLQRRSVCLMTALLAR